VRVWHPVPDGITAGSSSLTGSVIRDGKERNLSFSGDLFLNKFDLSTINKSGISGHHLLAWCILKTSVFLVFLPIFSVEE